MGSSSGRSRASTGKPRLDRHAVLVAALDLADQQGTGALTMRAVAHRLGAGVMTLYGHVADKDDMLDGLVELVLGSVEIPPREMPWADRLRSFALQLRALTTAHPAVLPLLLARRFRGDASRRCVDAILAVLSDAGFPPRQALLAFRTVIGYTVGASIAELSARGQQADDVTAELVDVDPEAYPDLRSAARHARTSDPADEFAYGLDVVLHGLTARIVPHGDVPSS